MQEALSGVITILLLAGIVYVAVYFYKRNKDLAQKYGAEKSGTALHMYGLPNVPEKENTSLFFTNDKIVILAKKKEFVLPYHKITATQAVRQTDLIKKDKSVIGRGIAGGLLLGPIGAIVGGMSAVGGKKNAVGEFLILNYKPTETEDTQVLIFDTQSFSKAKDFERFIFEKRPDWKLPSQINL